MTLLALHREKLAAFLRGEATLTASECLELAARLDYDRRPHTPGVAGHVPPEELLMVATVTGVQARVPA